MFGLTADGFNLKRLDDIRSEMQAEAKTLFGDNIDVSANSVLGQLIDIFADRLETQWLLAQGVYFSQYPQSAEGTSLDNVASITNVTRLPASKSGAIITITGVATTLVSAGFRVSVAGNPNAIFETIQDYTIEGGGTVDATVFATVTGETIANAGTLTVIETPVAGVTSTTNAADADIGRDIETDADFRLRRTTLLQRQGSATVGGIRSNVAAVVDVTQVIVIENDTDVTDGGGRPPHSFETVVEGGADADIAEAIFEAKAAGIQTDGDITEVVTDSQGIDHDIKFSRPTPIDIYMIINITKNTDPDEGPVYPVDGDDQVETAVLAFGNDLTIGENVIVNQFYTPINEVLGVIGIEVLVGTAPTPTLSNNIDIEPDEISDFDSARITVNS